MSTELPLFLHTDLISFWYILSHGVAVLYYHFSSLFITFAETCILFSIIIVLTYIPTSSKQVFPFLHILTHTNYFCLLKYVIVILIDMRWYCIFYSLKILYMHTAYLDHICFLSLTQTSYEPLPFQTSCSIFVCFSLWIASWGQIVLSLYA